MILYLIGTDHKKASLDTRESLYRGRAALCEYWETAHAGKASVLITCNRIEVYGIAASIGAAEQLISGFKRRFKRGFENSYIYYSDAVLQHAMRLACGHESQLRGEYQIMQQLRHWIKQDGYPAPLRLIWDEILDAAEAFRADVGTGPDSVNIADLVFEDMQRHITITDSTRILVIGTGKAASLIAGKRPSLGQLTFVAGKNYAKAEHLARLTNGAALKPRELSSGLIDADAVICVTTSPHHVLKAEHLDAVRQRSKGKLYIYDLAMPRDVAPQVKGLEWVVLKDTDSLIEKYNAQNSNHVIGAEDEDTYRYAAGQAC